VPGKTVPTNKGNDFGIIRVPPFCEDDDGSIQKISEIPKFGRDFILVIQEMLAVVLTQISIHLLSPLHNSAARQVSLVSSKETKNFIGPTGNSYKSVHDCFSPYFVFLKLRLSWSAEQSADHSNSRFLKQLIRDVLAVDVPPDGGLGNAERARQPLLISGV
jgi:hypothetical protein